jgi:Flp pilus assembly protein TadG
MKKRYSVFGGMIFLGKCEGSALIEAAVAAPMLMMMILGIAEVGRVTYISMETTNAAKAAVSYGAQNQITSNDQAGMQAVARMEASSLVSSNVTLTVSAEPSCSCSSPDTGVTAFDCSSGTTASCPNPSHIEQSVAVTVTAKFDPLIYLPGLPHSYTLTGYAVQKRLQ